MRPLVITDAVRADVADLIQRAKTWPFSFQDLKKIKAGVLPAPGDGDDSRFVCFIPLEYRCVYTHEAQPFLGNCRHLSISVPASGKGPGVDAVNEIAKLFGFKEGINSADARCVESLPDDRVAVNLIQRILPGDET